MKAVNLIPADANRGSLGSSASRGMPTYIFLGVLSVAVALLTLYVLASNNVSRRQAKLTTLQTEVAQVQARSNSLNHYAQFSQMTRSRTFSVRQLAAMRFDWHSTLAQISQVVPSNTSLATLQGTAASPLPATGTASPTSSSAPTGTSIELTGCTKTQPDVAKLMSRLRLIDGVEGVTLNSSTKQESASGSSPAGGSASTGSSSASSGEGCGSDTPSFDLKITFSGQPATLAGGGAAVGTSAAGTSAVGTSTATSATPSTSGGTS
jgi:Tfp pilus assembly protein PilN